MGYNFPAMQLQSPFMDDGIVAAGKKGKGRERGTKEEKREQKQVEKGKSKSVGPGFQR